MATLQLQDLLEHSSHPLTHSHLRTHLLIRLLYHLLTPSLTHSYSLIHSLRKDTIRMWGYPVLSCFVLCARRGVQEGTPTLILMSPWTQPEPEPSARGARGATWRPLSLGKGSAMEATEGDRAVCVRCALRLLLLRLPRHKERSVSPGFGPATVLRHSSA